MSGFKESGISLDFPTNSWFRFQDCNAFKHLSGNHFKEMDVCWLDRTDNTFYLIELKDYTETDPEEENTSEERVWT